jgi:hypothetical protein
MNEKIEQRICIKFCCQTVKLAAETTELLKKAFRNQKCAICKQYAKFTGDQESVQDVLVLDVHPLQKL